MQEEGWEVQELRRKRQEARRLPSAAQESVAELADSANVFAWELYETLSRTEGNLIISPFSISVAMAMTSAGAEGETRKEMKSTLHLLADEERLHAAWGNILNSLLQGAEAGSYRLNVANRLWGQEGYEFLEPFLAVTRDRYGAELETIDFVGRPEEARRVINAWVADETMGRITNLIPPGLITSLTRLVLTNAIYFLGLWEKPFKETRTTDEFFFRSETDSVPVRMMHTAESFRYAEIEEADLQLLEIPYESDQISMIVVLPRRREGLEDLERGLDGVRLKAWMEKLREGNVRVHLPRFRIESGMRLRQTLSDMGMSLAFASGRADFSRMDGTRDLFISEVVHKSFVEVTEEGTEAAAATAVVMTLGYSTIGPRPPVFNADHPFLFLIRDRLTGSVLFIGRVMDPSAD
jgi:serpin B